VKKRKDEEKARTGTERVSRRKKGEKNSVYFNNEFSFGFCQDPYLTAWKVSLKISN
jgi:hypothetical protein